MTIKTEQVRLLLRDRYAQPEWALMEEVANGTGTSATNYADAIAMNMFESRGLEIHGFEIKVSRQDWLRELASAGKAEAIQQFCDRWWVVAPADVVKLDELPPTWGLLTVSKEGDRMRQTRAAPKLEPQTLPRGFVAAMLRNVAKAEGEVLKLHLARANAAQLKAFEGRLETERAVMKELNQAAVLRLAELKEKTGINFHSHMPTDEFAAAVRVVMQLGTRKTFAGVDAVVFELDRCLNRLKKVMGPINAAFGPQEAEPGAEQQPTEALHQA
jgi:hypothetical protein